MRSRYKNFFHHFVKKSIRLVISDCKRIDSQIQISYHFRYLSRIHNIELNNFVVAHDINERYHDYFTSSERDLILASSYYNKIVLNSDAIIQKLMIENIIYIKIKNNEIDLDFTLDPSEFHVLLIKYNSLLETQKIIMGLFQ